MQQTVVVSNVTSPNCILKERTRSELVPLTLDTMTHLEQEFGSSLSSIVGNLDTISTLTSIPVNNGYSALRWCGEKPVQHEKHKCIDFMLYMDHEVCVECGSVQRSIYDNDTMMNMDSDNPANGHICFFGEDHEFIPDRAFEVRIAFTSGSSKLAAPYSFKRSTWTGESYRQRVIVDLFKQVEMCVACMKLGKPVEYLSKKLLSRLIAHNATRSTSSRYDSVYACVYIAARINGYKLDYLDLFDHFKFTINESKQLAKQIQICLTSLTDMHIEPLSNVDLLNIYNRRANLKIKSDRVHEEALLMLDEVECLNLGIGQQVTRVRLAFTAALIICKIPSSLEVAIKAFLIPRYTDRFLLCKMPTVSKLLKDASTTLRKYIVKFK